MLNRMPGLPSPVSGVLLCTLAFVPLRAQDTEVEKLSIHGYLTQAFAVADKLPINGITKDGTWDYRIMALQLRYNVNDDGQFVVQLRNRRLGVNPVNDEGVELDWAYYRQRFGPAVVKVGRMPQTVGLYNELRLVGTVLPFFRAPAVFYLAGVETVEGVSLSAEHNFGKWSTESVLYGGGQHTLAPFVTPTGLVVSDARSEPVFGIQQWVNTPIQGLKFGGGYHSFEAANYNASDSLQNNMYYLSLEGSFEDYFVRSEYMGYSVREVLPGGGDVSQNNYYVQGGVKPLRSLWINAQMERGETNYGGFKFRHLNDLALGVSYVFTPNMVAKLEGHNVKGYAFDTFVTPGGPAGKTNYGIASFSVSF